MAGQNLMPNGYDIRANKLSLEETKTRLDAIVNDSREAVNNTPDPNLAQPIWRNGVNRDLAPCLLLH